MPAMRRRRFRIPVLSRLTKAWLSVAALGIAGVVYLGSDPGHQSGGANRIALAVEAPERIARIGRPNGERFDSRPERLEQPGTLRQPAISAQIEQTEAAPTQAATRIVTIADNRREPFSIDGEDTLPLNGRVGPTPGSFARAETPEPNAGPSTDDIYDEDGSDGGEIVITIDGKPATAPLRGAERDAARRQRVAAGIKLASTDAALTRETAFGLAPAPARDGRIAARYYARPFVPGDAPTVSLIVGGLGLNRALTEQAIADLPPDVTLAFAPYARDLDYWTREAREAGHEVLIEIPMESGRGNEDALGPAALMTDRTTAENMQRLEWLLSRYQGYIGATNYQGAKFSGDRTAMRSVLTMLRASGLAYFDDTGAAERAATSPTDRVATIDRLIAAGSNRSGAQIIAELRSLERLAEEKGRAVGKIPAYSGTIDDIAAWAKSLEGGDDLTLAPASVVLNKTSPTL